MPNIDGHEYTLLRDYDRGKYQYLTFKGKVAYLKDRVEFILLAPCKLALDTPTQSALGLVLTTAICAGISAASMDRRIQKRILKLNVSWADWLYTDVRCGLAHEFTIPRGGIEESSKYIEEKSYGPEICPKQLLQDFASGWSRYLTDVERDGPSKGHGRLFLRRFDKVFHD
jgi:hypothetical protein